MKKEAVLLCSHPVVKTEHVCPPLIIFIDSTQNKTKFNQTYQFFFPQINL